MQHLTALIALVNWHAVLVAGLELAALCAFWAWALRRRRRPGLVTWVLLLVLTARFALFATPVSWFTFYSVIDQAYIDPRERDIVANNVKAFLAPPPAQRYLAVGSSQTYALYSEFSKTHPVVGYYVLAGMGPLDYFTQYEQIRARRPGTILLFVSEFDLARPVDLANARLSDLPLDQWPAFFDIASAIAGRAAAGQTLLQVAIADLFPESKYNFLVTDLGRQITAKLTDHPLHMPSAAEQYRMHMSSLAELDRRFIPDQARFLEAFLARAEADGIPVVLISGQYNPDAYTASNAAIHREVIQPLLAHWQQTYKGLRLIDRSQSTEFSPADYTDGYHVAVGKGPPFVSKVLGLLGG